MRMMVRVDVGLTFGMREGGETVHIGEMGGRRCIERWFRRRRHTALLHCALALIEGGGHFVFFFPLSALTAVQFLLATRGVSITYYLLRHLHLILTFPRARQQAHRNSGRIHPRS